MSKETAMKGLKRNHGQSRRNRKKRSQTDGRKQKRV
jgi:hypothetical protein